MKFTTETMMPQKIIEEIGFFYKGNIPDITNTPSYFDDFIEHMSNKGFSIQYKDIKDALEKFQTAAKIFKNSKSN